MKLSDVGERALVKLARRICKRGPGVRIGIGDDAAAIDIDDKCLIATTDMLVAGMHFPPGTSPEQMGRKSVVAGLSDLAAMGAEPLGMLFSVGLPRGLDVGFVKRLMRGMDLAARMHGTWVVGGDLDESEEISIAGAAFGIAHKDKILTRSRARPGDLIAVTGKLGASSAGLKLLLGRLPIEGYDALIKTQLEPHARVREGMALARSGVVTSAIDVTDGLAANLWQLSKESRVKLIIDRKRVPEHPLVRKFATEHGFNVDDFVLFGGEDFELLFTMRPRDPARIKRTLARAGAPITVIGKVLRGKGVYLEEGGMLLKLPDRGYEHFR